MQEATAPGCPLRCGLQIYVAEERAMPGKSPKDRIQTGTKRKAMRMSGDPTRIHKQPVNTIRSDADANDKSHVMRYILELSLDQHRHVNQTKIIESKGGEEEM